MAILSVLSTNKPLTWRNYVLFVVCLRSFSANSTQIVCCLAFSCQNPENEAVFIDFSIKEEFLGLKIVINAFNFHIWETSNKRHPKIIYLPSNWAMFSISFLIFFKLIKLIGFMETTFVPPKQPLVGLIHSLIIN